MTDWRYEYVPRGYVCRRRAPTLHDLARRAAAVNAANGWDPCTWETVPAKLAFVGTEVRELVRGLRAGDTANIAEECADIAIRLLSMLEEEWSSWTSRVETRRPREPHAYASPADLVDPLRAELDDAVELWRKGKQGDVGIALELAVLETFRLADRLGVDLMTAIAEKVAKNATRGARHGLGQGVG